MDVLNELDSGWVIVEFDGRFIFQRFEGGQLIESYRSVEAGTAALYAVAITQGFEPPRALVERS
ncbi:MAG: hypothetical protein OIF55_19220 [Amphritea sp.]|nr:hypothetical protein [Amphritea sp.]